MLDALTNALVGLSHVVIGEDFNAWAIEWGSRSTARGWALLEAMARLNVDAVNVSKKKLPTAGTAQSP